MTGRIRLLFAAVSALAIVACQPGSSPTTPTPAPTPPRAPSPDPSPPPGPSASACVDTVEVAAAESVAALAEKADRQGGRIRVIVRLPQTAMPAADLNAQPAAMTKLIAKAQENGVDLLNKAGVSGARALTPRLPLLVAEMSADHIRSIGGSGRFGSMVEDRIAFPSLAESTPLIQATELWKAGGRGKGQSVAILDTGVDGAHPFLAGKVVAEACFSSSSTASGAKSLCPNGQTSQTGAGAAKPCSDEGCEHGTHVAGIAAGKGDQFSGVAPDAQLVAVQVFSEFEGPNCGAQRSPCIGSFTSDQIRGLDFVLQQASARHIASANMSLGGGSSTTACDTDLTKAAIDQLRAAGVATVIAAGNDGLRNGVSYPACVSTAVAVAASTKQNQLASFSNCGPQVALVAPGVNITSSVPGGGFAALSGTSMAAPHVAGAFAALRSLHPSASVDAIQSALKGTGLNVAGKPEIRLVDANSRLGPPAMAVAASVGAESALLSPPEPGGAGSGAASTAEIASLPKDKPTRFIARVAGTGGAAAVAKALSHAESAAKTAGVTHVERMGAQPMLVIEATPDQAQRLIKSGAVTDLQIDRISKGSAGGPN